MWDYWDLPYNGTHTYRTGTDGTPHISTFAAYGGDRPWLQSHRLKGHRARHVKRRTALGSSRLPQVAARQRLQAGGKQPERPEDEDAEFASDRF